MFSSFCNGNNPEVLYYSFQWSVCSWCSSDVCGTHRCCCCRCVLLLLWWAAVSQNPLMLCHHRLVNSQPEWHEDNYGYGTGSMWAWAYREAHCIVSEDACLPTHLHNAGSTPCLASGETAAGDVGWHNWKRTVMVWLAMFTIASLAAVFHNVCAYIW